MTAKKAIKAAKKTYKSNLNKVRTSCGNRQSKFIGRPSGMVKQIESIAALHAQGILSDTEFEAAKRKIIGI